MKRYGCLYNWILLGWPLVVGCGSDAMLATDTSITTATGTTTTGASETASTSGSETGSTGGASETSPPSTSQATSDTTGPVGCDACPAHFICKYEQCLPDYGPCDDNDDCPGDSYCDGDGQCIPYDVPSGVDNDPGCLKPMPPQGVVPSVQCSWTGPQPGDPTAESTHIYTTPVVANLHLAGGSEIPSPSIVVTTWYANGPMDRVGMLRVFDGRTCEEQLRAGGLDVPEAQRHADLPSYGTQWAIADLDGDVGQGGHPEIIGLHRQDPDDITKPVNLYAFAIETEGDTQALVRQWYGRDCQTDEVVAFSTSHANHGPSVLDLDGDAVPEIIMDELVFDAQGCLLSPFADFLYTDVGLGLMSAVADVDLDGLPDLVRHNRVAGWDAGAEMWVDKPWFVASENQRAGHIGIADAGLFSDIPGGMVAELPEVVVVSASTSDAPAEDDGRIRVQSLTGEVVWGPVELYHQDGQFGGRGGPPTISDFDGDGLVEFAAAGASFFGVYDPDCVPEPDPRRPGGTCDRAPDMQDMPKGVLWAQPSKDASSNITGSAIFDFDGDGTGEAVYRDECFLRVYNGASGEVLFSAPAWSGTGLDYPVIADVDADFATEIVVPRGGDLDLNCPEFDPLFPGGEPSQPATGFVILRDPEDRWASSRPVWNQHVYSVTHVTDDGRIPAAGDVEPNWLVPGLNNFRQNTQGEFGLFEVADLTGEFVDPEAVCALNPGVVTLEAEVCNRGTAPAAAGAVASFVETPEVDSPLDQATSVCVSATPAILEPTQCTIVSCTGDLVAGGNLYVQVDPEGNLADCHPNNNLGPGVRSLCSG